MASPTFNLIAIFDSVAADGTTKFSEGVLQVDQYTKIRQKLHFNGENGDRYLTHGWPDRKWTFRGYISAPTYDDMQTILAAIEAVIDEADTATTTFHALKDSFGQTWTNAQVHDLNILYKHVTETGYIVQVVVTGIV
jgi:hypothetical protein